MLNRWKKIFTLVALVCVAQTSLADDWRDSFTNVKAHLKESLEYADMSAEMKISLPLPRIMYVNIQGVSSMPQNNSVKRLGYLEVMDEEGHYFRKRVILRGQGNYSLRFPKKNFSAEFCGSDWSTSQTTDLSIGDWATQDKFHFKAFYTDLIRGISEVSYHVFEDVVADHEPYWERWNYNRTSKARCFPDGFPCAVYLNDKFYGIYSWQLRKDNKNMNMKKKNSDHVHLDGDLRDVYLFRGQIDWNSFEVRNPQGLYTMGNFAYNGDYPEELMDETSPFFDVADDASEVRAEKLRTAIAKKHIVAMSKYYDELYKLDSMGVSKDEFRAEFEKRYDVTGLLDYYVFYRMSMNCDGTIKNWQWFTYDGVKWTVAPYDLDQTFGLSLYGFPYPVIHSISQLVMGPFIWVNKYYAEDEKIRYYTLRENGTFTEENILNKIHDWRNRIGTEYYDMEYAAWPESPCLLPCECNDNWELYENWEEYDKTPNFNDKYTYHAGDICLLDGRMWRATGTSKGVIPYKRNTGVDNVERFETWIGERIKLLDDLYGYYPGVLSNGAVMADKDGSRVLTGIYSADGSKRTMAKPGVNIYRYSDGTVRKVLFR